MSWALAEIERLEQCWSRFRRDSELASLCTRAGEWVEVSAAMLLALTCASDLHRVTDGLFDPTILDALERAGYDRTFEEVAPDDRARARRRSRSPSPASTASRSTSTRAAFAYPRGVRVDLGGLGKGLAADLVSRGLVDRGARSALVSLGRRHASARGASGRRVVGAGGASARRDARRLRPPARRRGARVEHAPDPHVDARRSGVPPHHRSAYG